MKELQQIVANLQLLMQRTGLDSQSKLSDAAGVSQTHIGFILRGEKSPTVEILAKLARALGVPLWLLHAPTPMLARFSDRELADLVTSYLSADEAGRQVILRVAEAQASYPSPQTPSGDDQP